MGTPKLQTHNPVSGFIGPWLWASLPLWSHSGRCEPRSAQSSLCIDFIVYSWYMGTLTQCTLDTTPDSRISDQCHTTLDNCDNILSGREILNSWLNEDSDIVAPVSPCSWSNIYPEAPRIRRMSLLDIRDQDNGGWWSSLDQWEGSTAWEWPIRGRGGG